jgi:hypothetical protein
MSDTPDQPDTERSGVADDASAIQRIRHGSRAQRVELATTVILAAAALASAWCAYQSSRWSGVQAIDFARAGALRVESSKAEGRANTDLSIDISLFENWLNAFATDETELADFYQDRFSPRLKPAFEAWAALTPRTNPDAPPSPFSMNEYVEPQRAEAAALVTDAEQATEDAKQSNQRSDNYVLAVVLFASALFIAGISSRIENVGNRMALVVLAFVIFGGAVVWVATMPVTVSI